jgi:hypothetical protein
MSLERVKVDELLRMLEVKEQGGLESPLKLMMSKTE